MDTPLISFVIPIYNVEKWLPRCVDSVLAQTTADLEIILVDDGSADGCPAICDRYAEADDRISVIHKQNGGLADARNAGLCAARGEYIAFVDSDDCIEADYTSSLLPVIRAHHPDIIRFGFRKIRNGQVSAEKLPPYSAGLFCAEELLDLKLDAIGPHYTLDYGKGRILSAWAGIYRRSFLEENGIRFRSEREILNEDYLFHLQTMAAASHVFILPCALYRYDLRENSLSQGYRANMFPRKSALYAEFSKYTNSDDAEQSARLGNFYIDCIYNCFVNECAAPDKKEAVRNIRQLLRDPLLAEYLKKNRHLAAAPKTRLICLLMRCRMARSMHLLYRIITR